MIGRKDFTTPEWQDMQASILGTIKYVVDYNSEFLIDIKEQIVGHHEIKEFVKSSDSIFLKELTDFKDYKDPFPKYVEDGTEGIEAALLPKITNSVIAINKRDQNCALLFKDLILNITYKTAGIKNQADAYKNTAYSRILTALETKPQPITKKWDIDNPLA